MTVLACHLHNLKAQDMVRKMLPKFLNSRVKDSLIWNFEFQTQVVLANKNENKYNMVMLAGKLDHRVFNFLRHIVKREINRIPLQTHFFIIKKERVSGNDAFLQLSKMISDDFR